MGLGRQNPVGDKRPTADTDKPPVAPLRGPSDPTVARRSERFLGRLTKSLRPG